MSNLRKTAETLLAICAPRLENEHLVSQCDVLGVSLARAYLAEHDQTPITNCYATDPANFKDKWLLSIGFDEDPTTDALLIEGEGLLLEAMPAGPWRVASYGESVDIPRPKTRGDVRRLCAALAIELRSDE